MTPSKKAGILTFHCVDNYGAVLQCFALQEALKPYFASLEIINYCPKYLVDDYKAINTYSVKSILMSLYSLAPFLKKHKAFKLFRKKHLNISGKYVPGEAFESASFAYLFLGSDQIWNRKITRAHDSVFFGEGFEASEKIAYAASLGQCDLTESEKAIFFEKLKKVDCISVRENEAVSFLKTGTDKDVTLAIDPTLLVDCAVWNKLLKENADAGKYVLVYNLTGRTELFDIADEIASKKGLKVCEVSGRRKSLERKRHKTIYSASPEEFLSLIANAAYVVTDSFHGTAFSLIFKKNFFVIPHKTRGDRMKTLLDSTGLSNRICTEIYDDELLLDIDFSEAYKKLELLRKKSLEFIENSISE